MLALVFPSRAAADAARAILFEAGAQAASARGWQRDPDGAVISINARTKQPAPDAPRVAGYQPAAQDTQGRWCVQHPSTHAAMRPLPEAERAALLTALRAAVEAAGLPWVEADVELVRADP